MSENQPPLQPSYAAYPRGDGVGNYGTSEKLFRLYRGYHGMSYTFLLGLLCYLFIFPISMVTHQPGNETLGLLLGVFPLASFLTMYYFCIRSVRDIGFGVGWPDGLSLVLGLFVPFMCLILCIVFSYVSSNEMKKYGLRMRSFKGINKDAVKERIAHLAAIENQTQPETIPILPNFQV